MKLRSWEAFSQQAEEMYRKDPLKTRYSIKYRHTKGKLEIRFTNDKTVLSYVTDQESDLTRLEIFNNRMFALMARGIEGADAMDFETSQNAGTVEGKPQTGQQQQKGRKSRRRG